MKNASFGFQEVPLQQKEKLVQNVFTSVATKYDLMNDLMSFGLHHAWKQALLAEIRPSHQDDSLLDVAGGTGDIASRFVRLGGQNATVCDLNQQMLDVGKEKAANAGSHHIKWVHGNAECLPFPDATFDYYTISFGIRNVSNIEIALKEANRVLKVGGKFACLEFSNVHVPIIEQLYKFYSFNIIPRIGKRIAKSEESYRYLVESIAKFHNAEQFKRLIEEAGLQNVSYRKLSFGVVAIHTGYKLS